MVRLQTQAREAFWGLKLEKSDLEELRDRKRQEWVCRDNRQNFYKQYMTFWHVKVPH